MQFQRNLLTIASRVWAQSFLLDDVIYWLENDHDFGKQAVFLIEADTPADVASATANLTSLKAAGVNIVSLSGSQRTILPLTIALGWSFNPYAH